MSGMSAERGRDERPEHASRRPNARAPPTAAWTRLSIESSFAILLGSRRAPSGPRPRATASRARQRQVGEVGARDEQDADRRRRTGEDERPSVSDEVGAVGNDVRAPSGHAGRLLVVDLPGEARTSAAAALHRRYRPASAARRQAEVVVLVLRAIFSLNCCAIHDVHISQRERRSQAASRRRPCNRVRRSG